MYFYEHSPPKPQIASKLSRIQNCGIRGSLLCLFQGCSTNKFPHYSTNPLNRVISNLETQNVNLCDSQSLVGWDKKISSMQRPDLYLELEVHTLGPNTLKHM